MTTADAAVALLSLGGYSLLFGGLFSSAAALAARHRRKRALILLWALVSAAGAVAAVVVGSPPMPLISTAYIGGAFVGVSTGVAAAAIWRAEGRRGRTVGQQIVTGTGAFLLSFPVAALVASVPDLIRFAARYAGT